MNKGDVHKPNFVMRDNRPNWQIRGERRARMVAMLERAAYVIVAIGTIVGVVGTVWILLG